MQNNYYFLRQLTQALSAKITGWKLGICFSQNKDELILGFYSENEEFFIKAILQPNFACLTFPTDFQRAKKNSVDLFKDLIDLKVIAIQQFLNERCFAIIFEQNYTLLFKMHGNRSNIILFQENNIVRLFRKSLHLDNQIQLQNLDRVIEQTLEQFILHKGDYKALYPTFDKFIVQYLESFQYSQATLPVKYQILQHTVGILEKPTYYIGKIDNLTIFSLLPLPQLEILQTLHEPIQAINEFFNTYVKTAVFDQEKYQTIKSLEKQIQKTKNYIEKSQAKLEELTTGSRNEEIANIIMANLHLIPANTDQVELYDFYHDQNCIIKIKKDQSPQKNAENYYRKAKNTALEVQNLKGNIEARAQEIQLLENQIQEITKVEHIKDLRKYHKIHTQNQADEEQENLFKRFNFEGFEILIGKNAKNNDLLTQKFAHKEDMWLHAKDVTGSHVVIKYQAGKKFPERLIKKAAQIAAFYSKRKNDSLCPVIYTLKKFVRKTKDLAEGQVIIDKESVILVTPENF